ncbi:hypothetical protein VTI74DRAFT_8613 [Chaetomium olivicolor]
MPQNDESTAPWLAEQCRGLASGLAMIHRYKRTSTDSVLDARGMAEVQSKMEVANRRAPEEQGGCDRILFGRHGDIKPENILWFQGPPGKNGSKCILKITDFGAAEFTIQDTVPRTRGVPASPMYQPPEAYVPLTDAVIGTSYDIWGLGCIYLEFITWCFGGWKYIETFLDKRLAHDNIFYKFATGTFFSVTANDETGVPKAEIKESVHQFINELHSHPKCTEFFHDFLLLIKENMLIVEGEGGRRRMSSAGVSQKLKDMQLRVKWFGGYFNDPAPWTSRTTLGVHEGSYNYSPITTNSDVYSFQSMEEGKFSQGKWGHTANKGPGEEAEGGIMPDFTVLRELKEFREPNEVLPPAGKQDDQTKDAWIRTSWGKSTRKLVNDMCEISAGARPVIPDTVRQRVTIATGVTGSQKEELFFQANSDLDHSFRLINELNEILSIISGAKKYSDHSDSDRELSLLVTKRMLRLATKDTTTVTVKDTCGITLIDEYLQPGWERNHYIDFTLNLDLHNRDVTTHWHDGETLSLLQSRLSILLQGSLNPFDIPRIFLDPCAVFIQVKQDLAVKYQDEWYLSLAVGSWFDFMEHLLANFLFADSDGIDKASFCRVPLTLPVITVEDGIWTLSLARAVKDGCRIANLCVIGDTNTVTGAYKLLACLRLIVAWVEGTFKEWYTLVLDTWQESKASFPASGTEQ